MAEEYRGSELEAAHRRIADLEAALFDLVHLERTQTPDMSGRRRTYAMMQNGKVLADCLDRARALLTRHNQT